MDADQKLTELKKAYAEVILNSAKEAAERIMVSERKVLRLEIELKQSKENALQMLMRLKQTMDAKTSEAEMASQAQKKRIEELEAQLQEAEDIVTDLRDELSAVHGEKASPPQRASNTFPDSDKEENNKGHSSYNFLLPTLKSCINDKDLPAIILRGKGMKQNRSWCTQRVHACEQTVVDKKGPSLINEEQMGMERASPNKEKRTSGPNQPLDHVDSGSSDKRSIPGKPNEEGINNVAGLVSVRAAFGRLRDLLERPPTPIRAELERPPTPIRAELERPPTPIKAELLPMGHENPDMPLSSEIHVDHSMALETGTQLTSGRVIKYTFQRKRKRGTNACDLSSKLKKNEENTNAASEPEKVISVEKSTQEETERVISIEKSTLETEKVISTEDSTPEETEKVISIEKSSQETEKVISTEESTQDENLELVAHQLVSLSESKNE